MSRIHHQSGLLFLLLLLPVFLRAQITDAELVSTILSNDSLFWDAFNRCDTAGMKPFIAKDVEFYHDKGGILLGVESYMVTTQNNLCSDPNFRVRREEVPGTLQLFPMQKDRGIYGAILTGEHYFYEQVAGKPETRTGIAKYTNLWIQEDGMWKMSRIFSYDHAAAKGTADTRKAITLSHSELDRFTGKYEGPQSGKLLVTREYGTLILQVEEFKFTLFPESANLFFVQDRDLKFEFLQNKKKEVTGITVWEDGKVAEDILRVK